MSLSTYQFNAPDADLTILSGEKDYPTEFQVHRCILAAASPFFCDMFTLPQDPSSSEKRSVVPVSETSDVLDTLLRFVYPTPDPVISSLEELIPILGAAVKYDFLAVIVSLRRILTSPLYLQSAPIRVYAIACRYDFEQEAALASRHTLSNNILDAPLTDDLKHITAHSYHRLLELHHRRSRSALALLKIPEQIKCMQCNGNAFNMQGSPKWWDHYEKAAREELAVRPTSDVIFEPEFLYKAGRASGCQRCPESILDSWKFLRDLRANIDMLPATIN